MNFEEKTYNAKVKYTWLGIEENGTVVFALGFDCKGGTYSTLKLKLEKNDISYILQTLEVKNWEALPCKFARVKVVDRTVVAIGNIINDVWFDFRNEVEH